jgi:hypothetical protein
MARERDTCCLALYLILIRLGLYHLYIQLFSFPWTEIFLGNFQVIVLEIQLKVWRMVSLRIDLEEENREVENHL